MIIYINTYKVKPNMMDQLVAEIRRTGVEAIYRKQPGNICFNYSVAVNDENTFYLTDAWQDEATFEAHLNCEATPIWHKIKEQFIEDKIITRYDA